MARKLVVAYLLSSLCFSPNYMATCWRRRSSSEDGEKRCGESAQRVLLSRVKERFKDCQRNNKKKETDRVGERRQPQRHTADTSAQVLQDTGIFIFDVQREKEHTWVHYQATLVAFSQRRILKLCCIHYKVSVCLFLGAWRKYKCSLVSRREKMVAK